MLMFAMTRTSQGLESDCKLHAGDGLPEGC